ncbi:MAG: neutral/alkaline non-lysosomal ceramidase N-terminal domain-containing protein [Pyrinomonadaceae bacterium]
MVRAGFGKAAISPSVGDPLAGFAARQGNCEGIHDELFSRALVLESDGTAIAIISLDVLAVPSELVDRLRAGIEERTGIPREAVMIASTHTHAGPVTIKTFFNPDGALDSGYMASFERAIYDSVLSAWESREPAKVGVGSGTVKGIGVNRRTADKKPVDEEVGIIKVEDESGKVRAVIMNYSCHPTVLGSDNLLATGDFPYFAIEKVEQGIGENGFAMFVNGTQGNISMGHSSELSAIGVVTPGRTFEHAEELGHKLADATLASVRAIEATDSLEIKAMISRVRFPLKALPEPANAGLELIAAEKELAAAEKNGNLAEAVMAAKSKRLYASITNFYARETAIFEDGNLPVDLQGVRIGDAALFAIPAEVFVEIGLRIKQRTERKVFVVGIANGYIGYLPTADAYEVGGYEVISSKVAPESEALLYGELNRLEASLFS